MPLDLSFTINVPTVLLVGFIDLTVLTVVIALRRHQGRLNALAEMSPELSRKQRLAVRWFVEREAMKIEELYESYGPEGRAKLLEELKRERAA